jgi:hypothetical protein
VRILRAKMAFTAEVVVVSVGIFVVSRVQGCWLFFLKGVGGESVFADCCGDVVDRGPFHTV